MEVSQGTLSPGNKVSAEVRTGPFNEEASPSDWLVQKRVHREKSLSDSKAERLQKTGKRCKNRAL